jgi:hypothetical protein
MCLAWFVTESQTLCSTMLNHLLAVKGQRTINPDRINPAAETAAFKW